MRVIGVGFGRTGTASLKLALERMGVAPCYHMADVIAEPHRASDWLAAARGKQPDWDSVFAGFAATVDWPGAAFWRELVDAYPQAKVILTVRDPERWYESMENTILRAWRQRRERPPAAGQGAFHPDFIAMTDTVVSRRVFDGRAEDRQHAIATYERHVAAVRAEVPAERLLEYAVTQGWGPLCDFLGVPAPDGPFPRANDSAEFNRRQAAPEAH